MQGFTIFLGLLCLLSSTANATLTTSIEVRESSSPTYSLVGIPIWDEVTSSYIYHLEEVQDGERIRYEVYNNSTDIINWFAIGVDSDAGATADRRSVMGIHGWNASIIQKDDFFGTPETLDPYWDSTFNNYQYLFYARVQAESEYCEPGDECYIPPGSPIQPFSRHEFSFDYEFGAPASPTIFSVSDPAGQSRIVFGETIHEPSSPVPEPATMLLFGSGMAGLVAANRRRKK